MSAANSMLADGNVHCADSLQLMAAAGAGVAGAVVTGLPDMQELGMATAEEYTSWFMVAVGLCCRVATPGCPVVLCQTDRKHNGQWLSKPQLAWDAAAGQGYSLLWHKVVLRRPAGSTDLHRPGYSHLLAYGKGCRPGAATPDVLLPSKTLYGNGMPLAACALAVQLVVQHGCTHVLDPFCGRGTTLAVAAGRGLVATGIDIDPVQCGHARNVQLLQAV